MSPQGAMRFSRARIIYRFLFFKKVFTLSHRAYFLLIFMRFECEGFDFKAFTPGVKACEGIEGTGIHTGNSWKSGRCGIIAPYAVNTWDFNPSHSKRMKIRREHALCERVNVFLRIELRIERTKCWNSKCKLYHIFLASVIPFPKLHCRYSSPAKSGSQAGSCTGFCSSRRSVSAGTYLRSTTRRNIYSSNHSSVMIRWPR